MKLNWIKILVKGATVAPYAKVISIWSIFSVKGNSIWIINGVCFGSEKKSKKNVILVSNSFSLCGPRATYSQFIPEGVLANILGIVLVLFGVLLGYLITREEYRRPPNPEEESLSVHFKTLTEGQSPTTPWPQWDTATNPWSEHTRCPAKVWQNVVFRSFDLVQWSPWNDGEKAFALLLPPGLITTTYLLLKLHI